MRVRLCVCHKDGEIERRLDQLDASVRQYRCYAQLVCLEPACTPEERHRLNDSATLYADQLGRLLDRRRGLAAFQAASAHDKVVRGASTFTVAVYCYYSVPAPFPPPTHAK